MKGLTLRRRPRGGRLLSRGLVGLAVALAATLAMALSVGAQEPETTDAVAKDAGYGDIVLRGVGPIYRMFLPGPGLFEVADEGSYIHLDFSHASVLEEQASTLRIDFNHIPVTTFFLTYENAGFTSVEIPIPGKLVDPLVNGITFYFFMRISDNLCRDWGNPALTATIFNTSYIHYELTGRRLMPEPTDEEPMPALIERLLEDYPIPLLELRKPMPDPITIVLPSDPTSEDLTAALSIATELARLGRARPLPNVRLVRASAVTAQTRDETNLVVIGTPEANPEIARLVPKLPLPFDGSRFYRPDGSAVPRDSAVIAYVESPVNPERTVLLASGGSPLAIRRAGITLSSERLLATLSGAFTIVSEAVEIREEVAIPPVTRIRRTLEELGVGEISVAGAGVQAAAMGFLAPPPGVDNTFRLEMTHSALLMDISTVDLLVNRVLVAGFELDWVSTGTGAVTVEIPRAALKAGYNTLLFRFQLIVDEHLNCGDLINLAEWVTILRSSVLDLEVGRPEAPDFSSLPHPFLTPDGWGNAVIVANPIDNLDGLVWLMLELGRISPSDENWVRVVTPDEVDEAMRKDHDLLLYGTFGANSYFDEVMEVMPLRFDAEVGLILQGRAGELLGARGATDLAVLQIAASPFNPERRVLMVAATSPDLLMASAEAIAPMDLAGNLATITEDGEISTLEILVPTPPPTAVERVAAFGLTAPVLAAVVAALVLAAILGAIAYQVYQGPGGGRR